MFWSNLILPIHANAILKLGEEKPPGTTFIACIIPSSFHPRANSSHIQYVSDISSPSVFHDRVKPITEIATTVREYDSNPPNYSYNYDHRWPATNSVRFTGYMDRLLLWLFLVFVTGNAMKLQEVRAILGQSGIDIDSKDLDSKRVAIIHMI